MAANSAQAAPPGGAYAVTAVRCREEASAWPPVLPTMGRGEEGVGGRGITLSPTGLHLAKIVTRLLVTFIAVALTNTLLLAHTSILLVGDLERGGTY
jgi:hypothetical protein